jgi:formyltetrahydrofolate deformylase
MSDSDIWRLLICCPDRPGIVAALSGFLFAEGANILRSDQHSTDPEGGTFFMRIAFRLPGLLEREGAFRAAFAPTAEAFSMQWQLSCAGRVQRLAVFVSRAEHALLELLWQCRSGDISARIEMVLSNHPDLAETVRPFGIPFHQIPIHPDRKQEAEVQQLDLMQGRIDTVILARYMQIVGPALLAQYPHRVINIHHSFLPAFVGADPYGRAHARGVKLIGATAHYATEALDEGPIIAQDVQRVDHRHDVEAMKRIGRHIERVVLARAVAWHVEDRILVHGNKTVVFA